MYHPDDIRDPVYSDECYTSYASHAELKRFKSFGIGIVVYWSHQEELTRSSPNDTEVAKTTHRKRNPCGLGNLLDVLGLIAIFAALALFFFPHE